ncbi:hypothetical protein D9M69_328180 [compost metagenome]
MAGRIAEITDVFATSKIQGTPDRFSRYAQYQMAADDSLECLKALLRVLQVLHDLAADDQVGRVATPLDVIDAACLEH